MPAGAPQAHAGLPAEFVVEWHHFHAVEQPRDRNRTSLPASPDLAYYAAVRDRRSPGEQRGLQECHHPAITAFSGNERAGVEDECHAAPCERLPRTTVAPARVPRTASAISSSVMVPCSASYAARKRSSPVSLRS
jgi:hypothetical protein